MLLRTLVLNKNFTRIAIRGLPVTSIEPVLRLIVATMQLRMQCPRCDEVISAPT
jgi:hypothetical protein